MRGVSTAELKNGLFRENGPFVYGDDKQSKTLIENYKDLEKLRTIILEINRSIKDIFNLLGEIIRKVKREIKENDKSFQQDFKEMLKTEIIKNQQIMKSIGDFLNFKRALEKETKCKININKNHFIGDIVNLYQNETVH